MSWKATAFAKEITENITQSEKLVLLVLADYHHTKHQAAWPSVPVLAKECLCTERTMYRLLGQLADKGFITIRSESGRRNEYIFPALDTPDIKTGVLTTQPLTRPLTFEANTPDMTPDIGDSVIRKEPVIEQENRLKRAIRFPKNLQPDETNKSLARELGVNLRTEFPAFRDYHIAKGSTFLDWPRAVNTWIRNAAKFSQTRTQSNWTPPQNLPDDYESPGQRRVRELREREAMGL
jgi:hypothetical protein